MSSHLILSLIYIVVLACSSSPFGGSKQNNQIDKHRDHHEEDGDFGSSKNLFEDKGDSDSEDLDSLEDRKAARPIGISGAYLVCAPQAISSDQSHLYVSCHFEEADHSKIEEVSLEASDIEITDTNNKRLNIEVISTTNGVHKLKVLLSKPDDININIQVVSYQGDRIKAKSGEYSPTELATTITSPIEDIAIVSPEEEEEIVDLLVIKNLVADNLEAEKLEEPQGNTATDELSSTSTVTDTATDELSSTSTEGSSSNTEGSQPQSTNTEPETPELADCSNLQGGDWVSVPGSQTYQTSSFCIMKYEAKCEISDGKQCTTDHSPISQAGNTPWWSVTPETALERCQNLGGGSEGPYSLVSNDQWMTLATHLSNLNRNWNSGEVGTDSLYRGHSTISSSEYYKFCQASVEDDSKPYVKDSNTLNCELSSDWEVSGDSKNRRTFYLSDDSDIVIWDIAGNVSEWVTYPDSQVPTSNPQNVFLEYNSDSIDFRGYLNNFVPFDPIDNNQWQTFNGIGKFSMVENGKWLARGGGVSSDPSSSGIFTARFLKNSIYVGIGFRCAYTPQTN